MVAAPGLTPETALMDNLASCNICDIYQDSKRIPDHGWHEYALREDDNYILSTGF